MPIVCKCIGAFNNIDGQFAPYKMYLLCHMQLLQWNKIPIRMLEQRKVTAEPD